MSCTRKSDRQKTAPPREAEQRRPWCAGVRLSHVGLQATIASRRTISVNGRSTWAMLHGGDIPSSCVRVRSRSRWRWRTSASILTGSYGARIACLRYERCRESRNRQGVTMEQAAASDPCELSLSRKGAIQALSSGRASRNRKTCGRMTESLELRRLPSVAGQPAQTPRTLHRRIPCAL